MEKKKQSGLWILILIVLLLVCGGLYVGYRIIYPPESNKTSDDNNSNGSNDTNNESTDNEVDNKDNSAEDEDTENEETACIQNTAPSGWSAVENSWAGYTAYRPGWYYRIFNGGEMLGMGPSPIPVDSEYAGLIVIYKQSGTLDASLSAFRERLEAGYIEQTITAGCREWTVFEGTEPANEIFGEKKVKAGFISVNGKTFSVQYSTDPSTFPANEAKFDTLIDIMIFN